VAYVDRVLLVGELIERRPRFSRFAAYGAPLVEFAAIAGVWTLARFVLLGAALPEETAREPALFWIYIGGLALLAARFLWRMAARFLVLAFSELAVTNRRYMEKEGVLDVSFWATDLEKIQRVEIEQPLLGRLFDYGDITIVTLGEVKHTTRAVGAPIQLQQALHARMTLADARPPVFEPGPRLSDERAVT
jgi:uncharacterized membrane protein YdbT with pleckstrin-like domain